MKFFFSVNIIHTLVKMVVFFFIVIIISSCTADVEKHSEDKIRYEQLIEKDGKIEIPFTCRDFRGFNEEGTGEGFITQEIKNLYGSPFAVGKGHPNFENYNVITEGLVENKLGKDGLPVFLKAKIEPITKESFDMWYRDVPGINKNFNKVLTLYRTNDEETTYEYKCSSFFPIDGEGFGNGINSHNYGFTDDMCFYLKYGGFGLITIEGDDDIWIFINGNLAVDLGGCHSPQRAAVNLLYDQEKYIDGKSLKYNSSLDILENQYVEVRIFHAERHSTGSTFNLKLTLSTIYEER